ncbi:CAP domain-containing protein [Hutsoniella sourekii]
MKSHYRLAFVLAILTITGMAAEDVLAMESGADVETSVNHQPQSVQGTVEEAPSEALNIPVAEGVTRSQPVEVFATDSESAESSIVEVTSLRVADVEAELSSAIQHSVNELRAHNNQETLQIDSQLQEAADKLVKTDPIGSESDRKDPHANDDQYARQAGFQQSNIRQEAVPVVANHAKVTYTFDQIRARNFKQLADDFVNKWFLDLSDSNKNHRKQLLVPDWNLTGIGVSITPRIIVEEVKSEHMLDKYRLLVNQELQAKLIDGFDISVTQYFGSSRPIQSTHGLEEGVSLNSYDAYVLSQVGVKEWNPSESKFTEVSAEEANHILIEQRERNIGAVINYPAYQESNPEAKDFFESLRANQNNILSNDVLSQLDKELEQIIDWRHHYQPGSQNLLSILYSEDVIGQRKVVYKDGKLEYHVIDRDLQREIDNRYSRISSNLFNTKEDAEAYGKTVVEELGEEDYYYDLRPYYEDGNVDHYSVWFKRKRPLDLTSKIGFTKGELGTDDLKKFRSLKYTIDSNSKIVISEETPVIYEDYPLLKLDRVGTRTGVKGFISAYYWLRILHGASSESIHASESVSAYQRNPNIKFYASQQEAKQVADLMLSNYEYLPEYAKDASELFSPEQLKSVKSKDDYLDLFTSYIDPYNFIVIYPKYWDELRDLKFKSIKSAHDFIKNNIIEGLDIYLWRNTDEEYGFILENEQILFTKEARMEAMDLIKPSVRSIIVSKNPPRYGVPHVFKIGEFYFIQERDEFNDIIQSRVAYGSFEEAMEAGQAYVASRPEYVYDIFQVDDSYVVTYGKNLVESRWNPDRLSFNDRVTAQEMAEYIRSLPVVKKFDYQIVPNGGYGGNFKIRTDSIEFTDDYNGYLLVPAYLFSGNAGVDGEHFTGENQIVDFFSHLRRENQPTPSQPGVVLVPSESPRIVPDDENRTIVAVESTHNVGLNPRPMIGATTPDSQAQGDSSIYQLGSLQVKLTPLGLSEVVQVLLEDYREVQDKFKDTFAYLYNIQFVFGDVSQESLSEPAQAEIVLADGQEVDQVLRYDVVEEQILEELDFEVIDDFDSQGRLVRKLVFEVSVSGYYGVVLK